MKKNIKNILAVLVVAALAASIFISVSAFSTQNINVLGVAVEQKAAGEGVSLNAKDMNEYENAIASMINNVRAENGLNALAADPVLNSVAGIRSQDLIDRNYFSHYTPEGTNVFNVMKANGVSYSYAGENLAQSAPASAGTVEGFLNAWMNSPTHRDNILRAQYAKIGVSMAEIDSRRVVTTVFTN
jgi:uncharacterized protein YkwD